MTDTTTAATVAPIEITVLLTTYVEVGCVWSSQRINAVFARPMAPHITEIRHKNRWTCSSARRSREWAEVTDETARQWAVEPDRDEERRREADTSHRRLQEVEEGAARNEGEYASRHQGHDGKDHHPGDPPIGEQPPGDDREREGEGGTDAGVVAEVPRHHDEQCGREDRRFEGLGDHTPTELEERRDRDDPGPVLRLRDGHSNLGDVGGGCVSHHRGPER